MYQYSIENSMWNCQVVNHNHRLLCRSLTSRYRGFMTQLDFVTTGKDSSSAVKSIGHIADTFRESTADDSTVMSPAGLSRNQQRLAHRSGRFWWRCTAECWKLFGDQERIPFRSQGQTDTYSAFDWEFVERRRFISLRPLKSPSYYPWSYAFALVQMFTLQEINLRF